MRNFYTKSLLTALLMLCSTVASAQSFESNGISYSILSLSDRTVEVAHNSNYQGFIIIPSTTDYSGISFKVNGIGDGAFSSTKVTEMIIPEGVTYIGKSAFKSSTLKEIIIPNSVTSIGEYAFSSCTGLKSITIPNNVTTIENYAFYGCTSLTSITIPNNVTSIGEYAFSNCTGLTSVTIGNSITSIEEKAFYGCTKLKLIYNDSSLNLTIGSNQYGYIAYYAKIVTTNKNDYTIVDDYIFNKTDGVYTLVSYIGSDIKISLPLNCNGINYAIGSGAFRDCTYLTSITIPNSVTGIGGHAFNGCTGLTSIEIPNSVTSIGNYAFNGCTGLTSIEIPNSVTSIGGYAFSYCTGLKSITIPNSVTSIGRYAFSGCNGLTAIHITNLSTWCKISFEDYTSNPLSYAKKLYLNGEKVTNLFIPSDITEIKQYAFYSYKDLKSVTIPNSVKTIGNYAFNGCTGLTSITIPNSVTWIGEDAFSGCNGLTSIKVESGNTKYDSRDNCNAIIETATNTLIQGCKNTIIPESVTRIEERAFCGCSGLTSVTIPNSVTTIEEAAFSGCSGLTSVTIPNSVTTIEVWAFSGCSGLTSITIPNSVTTIEEAAFSGCSGLTEMYVKATTPPTIYYNWLVEHSDAFYRVPRSIPVYVPAGTKATYQATAWNKFTNIIEMNFGIKGDITGDESVDVGDITTLVSIILDDSLTADAADVNSDGSVDVGDITEVVNIILNPDNDDEDNSDDDNDDNTTVTPTIDSRAVDLGLPSGLKWASCNVGATAPEEYGGYYAWGETEEKSNYSWSTYKYCNGTYNSMTKYCTDSSYGTVDNKTTLEPTDDVATVKWGGNWRMPTTKEQQELIDSCTWTWTTLNGVNGYRVTGPNGNSIFLPDTGHRYGTKVYNQNSIGNYLSSSLIGDGDTSAPFLHFSHSSSTDSYFCGGGERCSGYTVRPVCE